MRQRSLVNIALLSATAVALAACSNSSSGSSGGGGLTGGNSGGSSSGKTYTIGFQGPLSGDNQQLGINERNAVELAVEQANAKGDLNFKLKYTEADDVGAPATAPPAAAKLIQDDSVVAVVGPSFSGATKAVAKNYADAKLAIVSPSATNTTLTSQGFSTFFRVVPPDSAQGTQAADYIAKKGKSIYLIDDTSEYGTGLAKDIETELKVKGAKYVREGVADTTQDYSAIAAKVASSGADVMYYAGYYSGASLFAKALASAGYKGLAVSGDGSKDAQFIAGAGTSGESWEFTCPCADATVDPNMKSFADAYNKKWSTPSSTYSPEAFDATNAIIDVMKGIDGDITREKVVAGLKTVNYKGLTNTVKFQANGEIEKAIVFLYKVKSSKLSLVGTVTSQI
ncbi:MAG: branched-chain amino acid transporter substrate-binding protein [Jatrophihabitantaceae bacterium]|nr:branched-chain amino acid transporter substrate-binding protein [Jatrophihabitantaceae bacterium]